MEAETVRVDIPIQFLYPGMILKGDAYDEAERLVLSAETPVDPDFIQKLKVNGVKTLHYKRQKLIYKKAVSNPMISDSNLTHAMEIIDQIEGNIRNFKRGIPQTEVAMVIGGFIADIRRNEDAFLNLLDLFRHDDYTYTHSINVATISLVLGMQMKLDEQRIQALGMAALLHDVGNAMISREILEKPGKLTSSEWCVVKNHPVYSYNLIRAEGGFDPRTEKAVLMHHEEYAGGGYPLGTSYEKQEILPQILTVADVFDALTSRRPYKEAWPVNEAFTYFMENSGRKFNPQVTQVFLREMVGKINEEPLYPDGSYVLLNTGEIGYVVGHRHSPYTLRPIVNIFYNPQKSKDPAERILKHALQIDLERDYTRYVVKRVLDDNYTSKFDAMLGKGPDEA